MDEIFDLGQQYIAITFNVKDYDCTGSHDYISFEHDSFLTHWKRLSKTSTLNVLMSAMQTALTLIGRF